VYRSPKYPSAPEQIEEFVASMLHGTIVATPPGGYPQVSILPFVKTGDEIELHSGTLVVSTSSPALAHQLRLDSEAIIGRLNSLELGRKVRSIRVRIGNSTPSQ